ncbi:MAG: hypothetical protein ACJAZW_001701, partial [Maritalea sp.]
MSYLVLPTNPLALTSDSFYKVRNIKEFHKINYAKFLCKRNLVMSHISKLEMSHQVDLSVYGEACKYGIV